MPIRPYLEDHPFDPETVRLLGLAFVIARAALKLEDGDDPANRALAGKLIELAKYGERDPNQLAERASALLGAPEWASCPTMWPSAGWPRLAAPAPARSSPSVLTIERCPK